MGQIQCAGILHLMLLSLFSYFLFLRELFKSFLSFFLFESFTRGNIQTFFFSFLKIFFKNYRFHVVFYAPIFGKVEGANCFGLVRLSVLPSVRPFKFF